MISCFEAEFSVGGREYGGVKGFEVEEGGYGDDWLWSGGMGVEGGRWSSDI